MAPREEKTQIPAEVSEARLHDREGPWAVDPVRRGPVGAVDEDHGLRAGVRPGIGRRRGKRERECPDYGDLGGEQGGEAQRSHGAPPWKCFARAQDSTDGRICRPAAGVSRRFRPARR